MSDETEPIREEENPLYFFESLVGKGALHVCLEKWQYNFVRSLYEFDEERFNIYHSEGEGREAVINVLKEIESLVETQKPFLDSNWNAITDIMEDCALSFKPRRRIRGSCQERRRLANP
jgi:hypothetical protein